jgi:hypothetical protein
MFASQVFHLYISIFNLDITKNNFKYLKSHAIIKKIEILFSVERRVTNQTTSIFKTIKSKMNRIQIVRAQRAAERAIRFRLKREAKEAETKAKFESKELLKRQKNESIELRKQAKADAKEIAKRAKLEAYELLQKEKDRKKKERYEVSKMSISRMIATALSLSLDIQGFTASQFTNKYIEMYGLINPYTGEEMPASYDLHAAIRGLMYETSPSSSQHWFRYGMKKGTEQVAPWIFVNKELAEVNNRFDWMVSSPALKKAQRQDKGLWQFLPHGS